MTANASVCADAVTALMGDFAVKGKAMPVWRKLAQVEIFSLTLVDLKHLQSIPAFFCEIDFRHVGVFLKDLRQPLLADAPHRTPHRDGHGREASLPFMPESAAKGCMVSRS